MGVGDDAEGEPEPLPHRPEGIVPEAVGDVVGQLAHQGRGPLLGVRPGEGLGELAARPGSHRGSAAESRAGARHDPLEVGDLVQLARGAVAPSLQEFEPQLNRGGGRCRRQRLEPQPRLRPASGVAQPLDGLLDLVDGPRRRGVEQLTGRFEALFDPAGLAELATAFGRVGGGLGARRGQSGGRHSLAEPVGEPLAVRDEVGIVPHRHRRPLDERSDRLRQFVRTRHGGAGDQHRDDDVHLGQGQLHLAADVVLGDAQPLDAVLGDRRPARADHHQDGGAPRDLVRDPRLVVEPGGQRGVVEEDVVLTELAAQLLPEIAGDGLRVAAPVGHEDPHR